MRRSLTCRKRMTRWTGKAVEDLTQQVKERNGLNSGTAHHQDVPALAGGHWQALVLRQLRSGARRSAVGLAVQRVPRGGAGVHLEAVRDGKQRGLASFCG